MRRVSLLIVTVVLACGGDGISAPPDDPGPRMLVTNDFGQSLAVWRDPPGENYLINPGYSLCFCATPGCRTDLPEPQTVYVQVVIVARQQIGGDWTWPTTGGYRHMQLILKRAGSDEHLEITPVPASPCN